MKEAVAYNTEYREGISKDRIRDDVRSFIGEYRFRFQTYDYPLVFLDGKIRDPRQMEPLEEMGERSIAKREKEMLPLHREIAELKGLRFWQDQLSHGGNTVIYASPPGPAQEGYSDYGFVYFGKVENENLNMTAIRVEKPSLSQFNKILSISSKLNINFSNPDMFLQSPVVLSWGIDRKEFLKLVEEEFPVNFDLSEEKLKRLASEDYLLNTFIDKFVETRDIKYLYGAENRAIQLKENYDNKLSEVQIKDFRAALNLLSFQPPKVNGSCGVSAQSNRLFGSFSGVSELSGNKKEWFVCPKCDYHADGPVGNTCPGCGLTKEEFAKQGGTAC